MSDEERMPPSDESGEKLRPYTVLLSDEHIGEVKKLALRTGRKQSAMLRRLIAQGLEAYQHGQWSGE